MSLGITLVPPPPGPRIYRHRVFRRARDFGPRTYRRRRMGGDYAGETYVIAERPVVFPPEDYCSCNGGRPGCIAGPAPCDFAGLGEAQGDGTIVKISLVLVFGGLIGAWATMPKKEPSR